jgi:hypothetical protein
MTAEPVHLDTAARPTAARPAGRADGPSGTRSERNDSELLLGLADARQRLRRLPADEVRRHAHAAGAGARTAYSNGVRAAFVVAHDVVRTTAWDLGYAAGQEDAEDERRLRAAARRGVPGKSSPSWLLPAHETGR